ncbi:hypothetical protein [Pseudomonas lurida]|uniref:hypothetical protein n=1 Tax=Pseudomonas lurida TaxID=244566 RepID=UPI0016462DEC|nr:hypothetical protein [Pseudomonas lurida]MBC3233965.1 hypothetical protein [Pseudomonas lurida]
MSIPEGFKLVPVEPTAEMLAELAADVYPDDNNAGKTLQRLRGCDVVFPKYEVEAAVGKYQRMLASAPTPPQPIYDEDAERKLFEAVQDEEGGNIERDSMGYYENPYVQSAWDGWLACAQSRAKAGEDE